MFRGKGKYLVSGPFTIWIIGFILLPLCFVLYYAFVGADGSFTLENFRAAFTDSNNLKALWMTVRISVCSTLICFLLAYPLALFLNSLKTAKKGLIVFFIILPMWMNFMLQIIAINVLLEDNGVLNQILSLFGLPNLSLLSTPYAIAIGMVYDYFPFMVLPIYNAVSRIDHSVIEAAEDLGASRFTVLRKVIFPLSMPGIVSGITMVFVPSISDFAIAEMLGGSKVLLIGNIVEMNFTKGFYSTGAAQAAVLMVFVVVTMLLTGGSKNQEEGVML